MVLEFNKETARYVGNYPTLFSFIDNSLWFFCRSSGFKKEGYEEYVLDFKDIDFDKLAAIQIDKIRGIFKSSSEIYGPDIDRNYFSPHFTISEIFKEAIEDNEKAKVDPYIYIEYKDDSFDIINYNKFFRDFNLSIRIFKEYHE